MRIAFIVDTFPCLSETFILNQITGLIDLGHEITIFTGKTAKTGILPLEVKKYKLMDRTFCLNEKPESRNERFWVAFFYFFKDPSLFIKTLNFFKYGKESFSLNLFYKVYNFTRRGKFDIVQCHYGTNGNVGALLKSAGLNFKLVTMFHGYDIRRGLLVGNILYGKLSKYGDCFLSISKYNYQNLIDLGFDKERIVYHPVGIDLSKFNFIPRKLDQNRKEKIKILTVARLVEEKGLEYGIRAVYLLKRQFPEVEVEYTIAGDGPLREELKEIAGNLEITESINFLGACSHEKVIKLLEQSHIFLLPSIAEALPVSLIEAQAVGLPVVASNVGSVYQTLVEGKSGYLTKVKDSTSISLALKTLIQKASEWSEMSRIGHDFIQTNYDIKKLNTKLEIIYKRLLSGDNEK